MLAPGVADILDKILPEAFDRNHPGNPAFRERGREFSDRMDQSLGHTDWRPKSPIGPDGRHLRGFNPSELQTLPWDGKPSELQTLPWDGKPSELQTLPGVVDELPWKRGGRDTLVRPPYGQWGQKPDAGWGHIPRGFPPIGGGLPDNQPIGGGLGGGWKMECRPVSSKPRYPIRSGPFNPSLGNY